MIPMAVLAEHMTHLGDEMKTQGLCQSNGAAPAAWTVMTIPMIAAQQRKDYGAHFIAPITGHQGHLIGGLFVDDTNLFHLEMHENKMLSKCTQNSKTVY